ncbi:Histone deacetylase 5 [Acipenser ruthenus]|uniref:histone deacetylase n=1 Tax=Acipenser ruthenus TaxID=7906 RepID=A0A444TZU7_ACIRT|nr:Histone deacetylase 5 [Acipenser ruthenus]
MRSHHRTMNADGCASQLSLYTSPSLPNISLGLPTSVTAANSHINAPQKLSAQQEAERQAIQSMRQGGALTGKFVSTTSLPACLSTAGPHDADAATGTANSHSHSSLLQHVLRLEQARQQSALLAGTPPCIALPVCIPSLQLIASVQRFDAVLVHCA